jgi:hypothetical protein
VTPRPDKGHARGDVEVVLSGDVALTPAAARVLLRIVRRLAREAEDVSSLPVSPQQTGPGATPDDTPTSGAGDGQVGASQLGTGSASATPTTTEEASPT